MTDSTLSTNDPFAAREVADGVFWIGGCGQQEYRGDVIHQHMCAYLVVGSERSLIYDTGHPIHWDSVTRALDEVLGDRPLDVAVPSHTELPHSGNLGALMKRYPELIVAGDVRDYHLYHPAQYAEGRFQAVAQGDSIDLGDTSFVMVEALLRDLPNTVWGYDKRSGTLFVSDGFAYGHIHGPGQCRMLSSELQAQPRLDLTMTVNEQALIWTRFTDVDTYWGTIQQLLDDYPASTIAPAHGGVIDNPSVMIPYLRKGLEAVRAEEIERRRNSPEDAVRTGF